MKLVEVKASGSYCVKIGHGLLDTLGTELAALAAGNVFVVTDTNVAPHYLERTENSLKNAGFSVISAVLLLDASAGVSDISDTVSVILLSVFTGTLLMLSFSALHPARPNAIITEISISRFFIHITSTYTIQIFHGKSREIFIFPEKATYFA